MQQSIAKAFIDEDVLANDPTLSACCLRDLEDQRRAAKLKAELRSRDPIHRAVVTAKTRAGVDVEGKYKSSLARSGNASFPTGVFSESTTCDVLSSVQSSAFVVCLAVEGESGAFESKLKERLEGFEAVLLLHRFRANSCRDCIVNVTTRLPALLVYADGEKVLTMDRSRLEGETESSLLARLTLLKRQAQSDEMEVDSDDEKGRGSSRSAYFRCDKPGCMRTFYHEHVGAQSKHRKYDSERGEEEDDDDM